MSTLLQPGLTYSHTFVVSESKLVPALYPEAPELQIMPNVFATGFLVGLLEWTCIKAINPHIDWPSQQSVGTSIDIKHLAATPAGFEITSSIELREVDGRRLVFSVEAHDGVDLICQGTHERFIIDREKFDARLKAKQSDRPAT